MIVLPDTILGRMVARAMGITLPAELLHLARPATQEEQQYGADLRAMAYPYALCGGQPLHIQGCWPLLSDYGVCPTCAAANRGLWEALL